MKKYEDAITNVLFSFLGSSIILAIVWACARAIELRG